MRKVYFALLIALVSMGMPAFAEVLKDLVDHDGRANVETARFKSNRKKKRAQALGSFAIIQEGVVIDPNHAVPFNFQFFDPIGITFISGGQFRINKSGLYLISYGVDQANTLASAVTLALNNVPVAGTQLELPPALTAIPAMTSSTVIIPIKAKQVLSLVNTGGNQIILITKLTLTGQKAFITIKRVGSIKRASASDGDL